MAFTMEKTITSFQSCVIWTNSLQMQSTKQVIKESHSIMTLFPHTVNCYTRNSWKLVQKVMGVVMHGRTNIKMDLKEFKVCQKVNQTLIQSTPFNPCTEGTKFQSLQVLKIPLAIVATCCSLQRVLYSRGLKLVLLGLMPEWPQGSNKRHHDGRLQPKNFSSPWEGTLYSYVTQ